MATPSPGFNFIASGVDAWCNFLDFGKANGLRKAKASYFNMPNVTGNFSVTGLGFKPQAVIVTGATLIGYPEFSGGGRLSVGCATSGAQWAGCLDTGYLEEVGKRSSHYDNKFVAATTTSGPDYEAEFVSFDADGFTINVTLAPPAPWTIFFLALAGAGGYACGTEIARTTPGTQSITGLGFSPTGVYLSSFQKLALGNAFNAYMSSGAGDRDAINFCIWSGSTHEDAWCSSRYDTGMALTMAIDSSGPGGFGRAVLAQAYVSSCDTDGFTLTWPFTDGVPRYFSWFAFGGEGQVSRFYSTVGGTIFVPCYTPKALLGFQNSMTMDGWATQAGTGYPLGATNSLSVIELADNCLSSVAFSTSYSDINAPPFSIRDGGRNHTGTAFASRAHDVFDAGNFVAHDGVVTSCQLLHPWVGLNTRSSSHRRRRMPAKDSTLAPST